MTTTQTTAEARKQRIAEKLLDKGIEDLLSLNPSQPPVTVETPPPGELGGVVLPLSIDDIPAGFTDEQHEARNQLLSPTPTREEFEAGQIRSFNLKLLAEDYKIDVEEEYIGQKQRFLSYFAYNLHVNRHNSTKTEREWTKFERFLSKNHQKLTNVYHFMTGFWLNKVIRPLILTLISAIFGLFFMSISHADEVAIYTSSDSPVESLTRREIKDIFLLHQRYWRDGGTITVVLLPPYRSDTKLFSSLFLQKDARIFVDQVIHESSRRRIRIITAPTVWYAKLAVELLEGSIIYMIRDEDFCNEPDSNCKEVPVLE